MNAETMRAFTVYKSIMSDRPLPLAVDMPDRGTSLTPVAEDPAFSVAGSATRRESFGMAVVLAAILLFGFALGAFLQAVRG